MKRTWTIIPVHTHSLQVGMQADGVTIQGSFPSSNSFDRIEIFPVTSELSNSVLAVP